MIKRYFLREFYKNINGKSVWICCSAPTARPPKVEYDVTISISGGIFVAAEYFNCPPNLTIFDESTFEENPLQPNESRSLVLSKLGNFRIDVHSLLVNSNGATANKNHIEKCFATRPARLNTYFRAFIVNQVAGTDYLDNIGWHSKTQVGTGAWSVALCVFLGAHRVYVTGVNFRTGTGSSGYTSYAYGNIGLAKTSEDYYTTAVRNHSGPDSIVLAACALRHSGVCEFFTNEVELETLFKPNLS